METINNITYLKPNFSKKIYVTAENFQKGSWNFYYNIKDDKLFFIFISSKISIFLKFKMFNNYSFNVYGDTNNNFILSKTSCSTLLKNYKYKNSDLSHILLDNLTAHINSFFNISIKKFYSFYTKVNLVGLGYKNFVVVDELFFLLGDCNYLILQIPTDIKVYCKKSQIYLFSTSKPSLLNFSSKIKSLKKINYYKGKGILNFKNFKFLKLKVGKKQRFM